jgi:hypothetical protein
VQRLCGMLVAMVTMTKSVRAQAIAAAENLNVPVIFFSDGIMAH